MPTPQALVDAIYRTNDYRVPIWRIMVGPDSADGSGWVEMPSVLDCEWNYSIGKVPALILHHSNIGPVDVESYANYFKNITIDVGFGSWGMLGTQPIGVMVRVFTGRILDVNETDRVLEITAQGTSWPLDVQFHKIISVFDNIENNTAMRQMFAAAGMSDYDVLVPTWQIGTVAPQVLQFATYGEAITKVADVGGGAWFELPVGVVKVRDIYVNGNFNTTVGAARTYVRPRLVGSVQTFPGGVDPSTRLRAWRRERRVRETYNRCYVTGCQVTQINADGSTDNLPIEANASAPSPYVLNPDGSQAYNDLPFSSELIDQDTKAATEAGRIVNFENGMHEHITATVSGDPLLALMQNVRFIDFERGFDRYGIVTDYTCHLGGTTFSSQVTALYIDNSDAAKIAPIALFQHMTDMEVVGAGLRAIVSIDASSSFDIDGRVVYYEIADNQSPHVINQAGTSPTATGLYNPATVVPPLQIAVRVTDNDGLTDTLVLGIPYGA